MNQLMNEFKFYTCLYICDMNVLSGCGGLIQIIDLLNSCVSVADLI